MPYRTSWMRKLWNAKKILRFSLLRIQWLCKMFLQKTIAPNVEGESENESGIQDESQKCESFTDFLLGIRKHHSNRIIMAHINLNSLRNKFDVPTNSVPEYIDILMISETKLDDTFPHALHVFFYKKNLYKKMSLKKPKTLRKY